MTPRAGRREVQAHQVKERNHKDSRISADYRWWISFQGSRSCELTGVAEVGGEGRQRRALQLCVKTPQEVE